jgi:L,D-transpeptidase YnhG
MADLAGIHRLLMRIGRYPAKALTWFTTLPLTQGIPPARALLLGAAVGVALLSVSILSAKMTHTDTASNLRADAVTVRAPVEIAPPVSLLGAVAAGLQGTLERLTGDEAQTTLRTLSADELNEMRAYLGHAEGRLIEIYQLIGKGAHRGALRKSDELVRDHPNFHLAQLVRGDLLNMQTRVVRQLGDVKGLGAEAADQLAVLREESRRRLTALTERPPPGHVPEQFLALSPQSRHAIAVDASRSRLYLFENTTSNKASKHSAPELRLVNDFYISVGLFGIDKFAEGDKRTPLGIYYITSHLTSDKLPDFYGAGALPINYPNALDVQRGRTGSGIWLHGTPPEQFVRAPQASDGCVVLANPDLERLLKTVQIRTTPVVIAPELRWVAPEALRNHREEFEQALDGWRQAKSQGDPRQLKRFYSSRFTQRGRNLAQWWPQMEYELRQSGQRERELKHVSLLRWTDNQETMVVTFGEVAVGQKRGATLRQYWLREGDQWKIFYEGNA